MALNNKKMPGTTNLFQKIPFLRITSLFLSGILLNNYLSIDFRLLGIVVTLLICVLLLLWNTNNYSVLRIQNLLIAFGIVLSGLFYPALVNEKDLLAFDRKDYYLAEVCQKPVEKAKTFQTTLLIQNKSLNKPEMVIAYFSKNRFDTTLIAGDQIVILTKPQTIKNAGNPFEFDYQKMMSTKGIRFSVYLTDATWLKTGNRIGRITYKAEQIRDNLIAILATALTEKEERSVVSALTLGYRAEIDQETTDYFASTGAMHVLSVSGLHVGLIYFILGFLLSFIKRGRSGLLIFSAIIILFLWIYAFITGFSPSVQRATVMFTFVIVGNNLRRQVNIYNSLSASAFLLIVLNPHVIFDIGFQLSYLAVFGIVLIQPGLYNLFELTNPILKWSWGLFTVSVAAQLTTFPLGLFYFNQFPNLFWLSGFVVIPVTTLIIWLTLAFFVCAPLHGLALIIGAIIQKTTSVMLYLLKEMDALPMAVSKGIVLNPIETTVLFACIFAIVAFAYSKKKAWLFATLLLIPVLQISTLIEKKQVFNQRSIYVYNTRNLMIHFINGRTNYLITNGIDTLARHDLNMIERVQNHLQLDDPILINKKVKSYFKSADITCKNLEIQFLNCAIEFSPMQNNSAFNQDILTLTVLHPGFSKKETRNTTIATGNSYFNAKQEFQVDYKTKLQGAYCLSLN